MNKINLLRIEVNRHNRREESLINIIKMDVKNFYRTYKNKPNSVGVAYHTLFGKMATIYFMELISYEDYEKMAGRFFELYKFTEETAENHK